MQVSFWSNYHQVGTTHNMIATAILSALEYRMRILIAQSHFDRSLLEPAFMDKWYIRHELTDLSGIGIDALSRFIRFNRLEKEEIAGFTTTILKNRLDLLMGTCNTNRDLFVSNMKDTIGLMLQSASRFYDLVFIDTSPGLNEISTKVLECSDLIVVNISQNIHVADSILSVCEVYKDKIMLLLGHYDDDSRYNLKVIRKKWGAMPIQVIPYDVGFADACIESRAVDFFIRNLPVAWDDVHYPFLQGVRETVESIFSRLGIDIVGKKVKVGNGRE